MLEEDGCGHRGTPRETVRHPWANPRKATVPYFELLPAVIATEWNRCWPTWPEERNEIWSHWFARGSAAFSIRPRLGRLLFARCSNDHRATRSDDDSRGIVPSIKPWQRNYDAVTAPELRIIRDTDIVTRNPHSHSQMRPWNSLD